MTSKHDPPSSDPSSSNHDEEEGYKTPVKPSKPNPNYPQLPSDHSNESESNPPTPTALLDMQPVSAKRRPETNEKDSRKDQKKKKKVTFLLEEDNAEKQPLVDDPKKKLWTEDDELVILEGMLSRKNRGKDAKSYKLGFFNSIRSSLHSSDFTKVQVVTKMRTIERKFYNTAQKVNPGEDPGNLKPHDAKVYELSKKIWPRKNVGDNVAGEDNVAGDEKKSKSNPKATTTEVGGRSR